MIDIITKQLMKLYIMFCMPRIIFNTKTGDISTEYHWTNSEAEQTYNQLQEKLFRLIEEQRRSAQHRNGADSRI